MKDKSTYICSQLRQIWQCTRSENYDLAVAIGQALARF